MKSLFKFSFFTLMVIMTALVACNKTENAVQPENVQSLTGKVTQIFRLDGVDVPEGTFALDDSSRYIVLHQESTTLLIVNGFTSQEKYFQFGEDKGYDFRRAQRIEDHLSAYAESSGAIAEQEATGQIPKWWNQYAENYISTNLRSSTLQVRSVTTDLWENIDASGRNYTMVPGLGGHSQNPFLWVFGMSNKISSFHPFQVAYTAEYAYDRTWFRKRLFVHTKAQFFGAYTVNLNPANEDRAESWITLGI